MKVLHVNTSDHAGGAAIAALRIIRAQRKQGIDAVLLCRDRQLPTDRTDIVALPHSPWLKAKFVLERGEIFLRNRLSREGLFSVDAARLGNDITRLKIFKEADVVHLHWTNQAMLSLVDLQRILLSGKRVVWTMHDMWPFTGICHHASTCNRWRTGCGRCPMLRFPQDKDLSYTTFKRKERVYALSQMTFVGCSYWLSTLAQQAPLLRGHRVVHIPNPIDTAHFTPVDADHSLTKSELRRQLGLPKDKKLIFFTAFKVTDSGKGIDYLIEAASILKREHPEEADKFAIVLAGKESDTLTSAFSLPVYPMGYVGSEEKMISLYRACDVLAMPTLMDNLPNTVVEAMACGLPCVAFAVGGLPEMIDTCINGYIAAPQNSLDLACGLLYVLAPKNHAALCKGAREKAVSEYAEKTVSEKYLEFYQ